MWKSEPVFAKGLLVLVSERCTTSCLFRVASMNMGFLKIRGAILAQEAVQPDIISFFARSVRITRVNYVGDVARFGVWRSLRIKRPD